MRQSSHFLYRTTVALAVVFVVTALSAAAPLDEPDAQGTTVAA